jgi:hypothetical protein
MKSKKIEFRKRTRKSTHLVEKAIGIVAIVALMILVGVLLMETSWEEISFSGNSITGAAVEESSVANEVVIPEQTIETPLSEAPLIETIASEENMGIQAGGGEGVGILGDANSTSCGNVTGSLTLTANVSTTTTCFIIKASNIVLDCAGFTVGGDGGSSDSGVSNTGGYDNLTIQNCIIDNFGGHGMLSHNDAYDQLIQNNTFINLTTGIRFAWPFQGTANGTIKNNTFTLPKTSTSYAILGDTNTDILNNTFYGDYSVGGIYVGDNNRIWNNYFWGNDGTYGSGNSSLCVNGIGNFYNGSVAFAQVPAADCGPTPNEIVYVNQSRGASSFTFGGRDAIYPDLRTAVYNTWNGTNNIVYLLENHSTSYSQTSSAVHFVRSNQGVDCRGYMYSDTDATSDIYGFSTNGFNNLIISNCTIFNFDRSISVSNSEGVSIINNTFVADSEYYGIFFSNGDNFTITNNTFTGDLTAYAIDLDSSSANNRIWQNMFWGGNGIETAGTNTSFCVNGIGNFYNASVAVAGGSLQDQIPAADCGPTPNGTVYVNQSIGILSFTWGGTSATYPDLRTAVYNTWNGTNNTIYLLENHNTTYRQASRAVHFMRGNLEVNCLGHTYSDTDATSDIYAFTTYGYSSISIHNCTISNFNSGLLLSDGTNHRIYNNSFISEGENEGVYFSNADNSIFTNNTFSGDYTLDALDFDSSSTNNSAWQNQFLGADGVDDNGANNSLCVNDIGNFYNASVTPANVLAADCGPTPNGIIYVNQSAGTHSFTWNGSSATYIDLRTAVYNTYNGTSNKVYLLGNHNTTYTQGGKVVDFVRSNVDLNCLGYTFSDPSGDSSIDGFDTNSVNGISIHNCTISNFQSGLGLISGTNHLIYNNSFIAGGEMYGIFFSNADSSIIINNTFSGDYTSDAIDLDTNSANNNVSQNQFWGADGVDDNGANNSLCVNSVGNYYNNSVAVAYLSSNDCGPTPNSNVSVNSSISASSFTFSTAADANPVYKNLQEAYYNAQENRTMFLVENYNSTSTTQTVRNGTTLNCQNKRINSSADAININGEVGTTVSNCVITTIGNGIEGITLTSSATGNTIVNTRINTTGTTAYGVTFTSSNGNNIINSTFNIPSANDVYSSTANNNSIINSVFNRSDLGFTGAGSWLQVKWYVDVNVTNGTGGIANATVNIANSTSMNIFSGLSNINGQIPQQTITEFWQNGSLTVYETPHNFSANKTGYATNYSIVNLTVTNSTTVVLNLVNTLYPDLKINNSDLTYTFGTIRQNNTVEVNATIYNLGNTNATDANISFYVDSGLNQSRLVNISDGSSQLVQFNWTALGGNHTLEVKTDPSNSITESNETNNNATNNISVKYVTILQYLSPNGSFPRGKDVAGEDALFEIDNTLTAVSQVYDLYNSSHALSANCSFYFNETLLGTNLTNSSGHCSYTFDKTNYSYGNYNLTVNFTGLQSDAVLHTSQVQNTTPIEIVVLSINLDTVNHYNGLNYILGEMAVLNISITQNGVAYSPDTVTSVIRGATDPADGPSVYDSTLYNDSTGNYRYTSLITSPPNGGSVRWRVRINSTTFGLIGTVSHSDITVNNNDGNLSMNIINSTMNNVIGTQLTVKDATAYQLNQSVNASITNYPIRKDKNHTLEFVASSGEVVMLEKVNLNQTNNNLTLQIVSEYNGSLPTSLKNLTSVTGFESFPYNITNGNITIPKNGKTITSIMRCNNWNSTTATCAGTWSTYTTAFGENSTHIWFNITSFSGYAGGVPFSSNLTIWDETDSGMPFGNQIKYVNQQVLFFANYTNSTSRTGINDGTCNISFSTAPTGPFEMPYNSTYSLYLYNRSFSSAGNSSWNVTCNHSRYDTLTANDTVVITVDYYPLWESNSTTIVATYSSTQPSLFNITWIDDINISTAWFESNYSGTAINYSMNRIAGNSTNGTYNYSAVLPSGSHYWRSYANDSANQWNNTNTWTFSIARASSSINLTLNGTSSDITLLNGTAINVNCSRLVGEGNVELLLNGTLINSGTDIGNLTNFTSVGLQNATCQYNQTQNYSASTAVYWINVTPVIPDNSPNVTLLSPAAGYSSESGPLTNLTFSCNATDDNQLVNISLYLTNSTNQSFALNQSTNISGTTNNSNWTLELGIGNYTWNCLAVDNASQRGWGTANRSILLLPDITLPYFNPQPTNQTVEFGTAFSYDVNASDNVAVDTFAVNDTNFTVNRSGYITNVSSLIVRIYSLNISVNDTSGNKNSTTINITVQDTTSPAFTVLSNPSITYGDALSTQFNASDLSGISRWWINDTARFTINSTTGLFTNNGTIAVGTYNVNLSVNDTYNNVNSTIVTVTVNAQSSSSSSSGGGGGGPSCTSSWNCTEWSKCSSSLKQTRTCVDLKGCEESYTEDQDCDKCQEAWVCSAWSECKNNLQNRICTDYNDCGTIEFRPEQVKFCGEGNEGGDGLIPKPAGTGEEEFVPEPEDKIIPKIIGPLIGKAFFSKATITSAWNEYAYYLLGLFLLTILTILLLVIIKKRSSNEEDSLKELKKWILEEKQRGLSDTQIMTILLQHTTWDKEEIAQAFYKVRHPEMRQKK